jgi:hypothetical protein
MSDSSKSVAKNCCSTERKRLIQDIQKCDFCSTSWEEHHQCLSSAAKESGQRSKKCMIT